jgi:hypothetical protein
MVLIVMVGMEMVHLMRADKLAWYIFSLIKLFVYIFMMLLEVLFGLLRLIHLEPHLCP